MSITKACNKSLIIVLSIFSSFARADLQTNRTFRSMERAIVKMFTQVHVRKPSFDDKASKETFRLFLKKLDPLKIFFEADDIARFKSFETELDDRAKDGDLEFPELVYSIYAKRVQERLEQATLVVETNPDFTLDESVTADPETLAYPVNYMSAFERVRLDLKSRLLAYKLADPKATPESLRRKALGFYVRAARGLSKQRDIDRLEAFLDSMTESFDPHSSYMSPSTEQSFMTQMQMNLTGIGATLNMTDDGLVEIRELTEGGPAKIDGTLKRGDKIIGVSADGTREKMREISELNLSEVVNLVRGKKNTKVRLKVLPASGDNVKELELTRAEIKLTENRAIADTKVTFSRDSGKKYKVGFIYLPSFYSESHLDMRKILNSREFSDVDLAIVDLRDDGGGSLLSVETMLNNFSGPGVGVQEKDPRGVKPARSFSSPAIFNKPLMVVINQGSASASEIFAAAIQDRQRGLIVGSPSFGKGTVQTMAPMYDRASKQSYGTVKITVAEFFRINGDSTQNARVIPDVSLPSLMAVNFPSESDLPNALPKSKIDSLSYSTFGMASPELVSKLKERSKARITAPKSSFAEFMAEIEEAKKIKASKVISLNEATRRNQLKALGRGDDDDDMLKGDTVPLVLNEEQKKKVDPKVPNFYNKELMNIATDYLDLGKF